MKVDRHGSQETQRVMSSDANFHCSHVNCQAVGHHDEAAALSLNQTVIL